ncbi:hypothetical protein [Paracoccus aestuariivivens]|uniref:CopL family metal-binding regulatory protein n=1 Tax=Paracoccus aestuariivivens TaxID=1820333 RepID=A0A6L6JBL8_9RHOB|nr:hypothetical protein [Paracoccus aestuariivivens]MTH78069.1 hypothetical protein [Paracoccus aestuariivivens]
MVLFAIMSLSIAPYMAAGQAGDMASTHARAHAVEDHASPVSGCENGACAAEAACVWICSGLMSDGTVAQTGRRMVLKSHRHALPRDLRREGIAPPRKDRPPIFV